MKRDISLALYKKILSVIPVLTVDVVIVYRGKVLLVKRRFDPDRDRWWTPGGRVLKGEKLEATARRKAKEETGIRVKIVRMLGVEDFYFKKNRWGTSSHTPGIFFLAHPIGRPVIKLDRQSTEAKWFSNIPKNLHPKLKKILREAGF